MDPISHTVAAMLCAILLKMRDPKRITPTVTATRPETENQTPS